LKHVTEECNLTEVAHRIGYPDSAHLGRSVRQVFGLQSKRVIAGCRRLALYREPRSRPSAEGRHRQPIRRRKLSCKPIALLSKMRVALR
jgi:AraC-like DNA-binding protein